MEKRSLSEQELAEIISLTTFCWDVLGHFIPLSHKFNQTALIINEYAEFSLLIQVISRSIFMAPLPTTVDP